MESEEPSKITPFNQTTISPTQRQSSKDTKHFKVFQTLELYINSVEQIRLIDQLMKPSQKQVKQKTIKRVNAILLEIKSELDQIEHLCRHFISKEQIFIEYELITVEEWRSAIRKIDRKLSNLMHHLKKNFSIIASVYGLETKIFSFGETEWRKRCQINLRDTICMCIKA